MLRISYLMCEELGCSYTSTHQSLGEGYSQGLLIPCHFRASELLENLSGAHGDGKIPGMQVMQGERLPSPLHC